MDAQGQGEAEAAVQKLRADGQTNLWQGLETALELFRTAPDHGPARRAAVPAALVLTDGVPNVEPSGGHLQALRNYRDAWKSEGDSDLDSKLLDALAAGGGGGFVFIPDAGFVGTALVNCTAGALAAGGRNARLQLSLGDEVSLEGVLGYQLEEDGSLDLGSVQLGQRKDCRNLRCERERERDTVAVIDGEGKTSFQELQRRVEALAARIPHATVMPQRAQRNLGVCFERTRGVAARPCVPLPARLGDCVGLGRERLKDLMGLAKLGAVLCSQQTFMQVLNSWPGRREDVLDVENTPDTPVPVPHHAPDHVEEVPWCSTEPGLPRLYVIFTSGSTGRPKGVEGLESGCLNRLWWQWRCFPWAPGEVCCAHTALSFVDHVAELFGALLAPADGPADRPGPTVVGSAGMEVPQTLRCLKEHQVTRLVITPTLLKAWLLEAENLSFDPSSRVLNIYGSTEVSGDATCAELPEDDQAAARWWSPELPCGREIHGVQVEVLHVKEAGEELEVQQCGDGEELDQWDAHESIPLGSVGLQGSGSGRTLMVLGRCNQLVKLRGQRVELNSVQLALTSLELAQLAQLAAPSPEGSSCRPIFRDACCVVHQSALVAAVVFSGQWEGCRDLNAVRSALAELLPACAVPAHLLALPTLPTLTSGKVDRCAVLREVEASGRGHPEVVEALDVVEALVQSAWREALQTLPEVDATREAAEPPPYDAVLEAAEKSRAALVELCQRWRKRKRESVDEPFPCSPWQGMEPTAPVAAPAAPAPAAVLQKGGLLEGGDLDLRRWCLSWRADLHQCVDAPPLLVLASTKTPPVWWLLIGSHSQELGCFVADTGEERWRLRLSDRIEGGCTVGSTGRGRHRVFVGCYDGQLHCFDLEFGNLLWSSFVAHQESLTMPGAVFAAPVVEGWSLYVATTSGQSLTKFRCPSDLSAPPRAWARRLSAPLFATPVVLSGAGALLVASVDGVVRKLAESDGSERWSVQLDGHTFAAPCVSGPCAAIGTHGGSVFGLSLHRGDVLWKAQLGDVVYGTPFALGSSTFCVVTRKGRLCFLEGQEVWEAAQLEGEVFSSPVAWNATENTATGRGVNLRVAVTWDFFLQHSTVGSMVELAEDMILDFKYSSSASELCRMSVSYDGAEGEVTLEETSSLPGLDPPDADGTYQSLRLETFEVIQKILGLEALADAQREVEHFIERLKEAKAGSDDARLDGLLEDVQGQVSEAVSREASVGPGERASDPGVQCYGGEIFREVRDVADEIFLKLPAANPAIRSHVETLTALGFSEEEVQRALEYAYDDVEMAATYLMEGLPAYRPGLHPGRGHAPGSPPAPRTVDMAAYYDAAGG
eukprot:g10331.t1